MIVPVVSIYWPRLFNDKSFLNFRLWNSFREQYIFCWTSPPAFELEEKSLQSRILSTNWFMICCKFSYWCYVVMCKFLKLFIVKTHHAVLAMLERHTHWHLLSPLHLTIAPFVSWIAAHFIPGCCDIFHGIHYVITF